MKNTTHTLAAIVGIAGVLGVFAGSASAVIVQAPNGGSMIFSDVGTGQSLADNFIVGSGGTSLDILSWYGGYFPGNVVVNDSFTIRIHGDAGGIPDGGAAFFDLSGVAADTRTDTGVNIFGSDEYVYTLDLGGLSLGAGTYWLEIFNDTGANWAWEGGNLDTVNGRARSAAAFQNPGTNWFGSSPELAFSFTAVPAPGSLALLGLAGCASAQRRRR